jgi:hypothetical protein
LYIIQYTVTAPTTEFNNNDRFNPRGYFVFGFLWMLIFCLYFPAAKAGFVADFTGWLDQVKNHSFIENLNRSNYRVQSLYQFTQLATYVFYKLLGINPWLWHLLFVSLHALNAYLLYSLVGGLFADVRVMGGKAIAFAGTILFCVSPYISEVIVWEPSYHFLQGLLFILQVLLCVRQYARTGKKIYALWAALGYFISTFALEIFYITPWLILTLGLFYREQSDFGRKVFSGVVRLFFIPTLLLFFAHLVSYRLFYGSWVAHISTENKVTITIASFGKPAKYLFHLLFLGRFFPHDTKQKVYAMCDSATGEAIFYSIVLVALGYIVLRYKRMDGRARIASLLFVWMMVTLALLIPLWFQELLLVLQDRYTYFTDAFFYMLVVVLLSYITIRYVALGIICVFGLINLRFAIQVSRYWGKSSRIITSLLNTIPPEQKRTMLLLNLPQSMHGVAMVGAEQNSEFKLMHDLLRSDKVINTKVYDVMAYNMETPADGAHVTVLNDSTINVTLNQWGTWWWYAMQGGHSYENDDYRLDLKDPGHFYELTLRKPAADYLLLFQVGDQWKEVEWSKKGVEQD